MLAASPAAAGGLRKLVSMSYPFVFSYFSAHPVKALKRPGGGRSMAPAASGQP
jgi:hypothetical protein